MEKLLHYVWKHRLFPQVNLVTTDGLSVEVIDAGLHNNDAGPDFFNAKLKVGGVMWVGNVELHLKSSQWYQHGHERDEAYDNVVMHVVTEADRDVFNSRGERLRQLVISIPQSVKDNYAVLLHEDRYPRCYRIIPELDTLTIHSWMSALLTERMERKAVDIAQRAKEANGSWEDAYFQTLARNYGFGVNTDAFEMWAKSFPIHNIDHHRDDLFQIEAFFYGQAGMLDPGFIPERYREQSEHDLYLSRLRMEYRFLRNKFHLEPIDHNLWKQLRLRPQNFPQIRMSQLATLYYNRKSNLSRLLDCKTVAEMTELFATQVTDYWQTHYTFGVESERSEKHMSKSSIQLLILNTAVPMLFAYGKYKHSEEYVSRAISILEELKAEDNNVVRMWKECGLSVSNASDSQALLQLKREYCDKKECLRCRVGYRFLKRLEVRG